MNKKIAIYKTAQESSLINMCNSYLVSRSTAFTLMLTDFYKRYIKLCENPNYLKKSMFHSLELAKTSDLSAYFITSVSLNKGVNTIFNKLKDYFNVGNSELYMMLVYHYLYLDFNALKKMLERANESNRYLMNLGIKKNLNGKTNIKRI